MARVSGLRRSALNDLYKLCRAHSKRALPRRRPYAGTGYPLWAWLQYIKQKYPNESAIMRLDITRMTTERKYAVCDMQARRIALKYDLTRVQEKWLGRITYSKYHARDPWHERVMTGLSRHEIPVESYTDFNWRVAFESMGDLRTAINAAGMDAPSIALLIDPQLTEIILRLQLEGVTK